MIQRGRIMHKRLKLSLLLFIILSLMLTSCTFNENISTDTTATDSLTEKEKIDDFEYLYKTIIENYPFLDVNKRIHSVDWEANKDSYLAMVKDTKTDLEFFMLYPKY